MLSTASLNFRDSGIYIKTPIYLEKRFFTYYYSKSCHFKFDVDDLFLSTDDQAAFYMDAYGINLSAAD